MIDGYSTMATLPWQLYHGYSASCCDKNTWQRNFKRERGCLGLQFNLTFHQCKKVPAVRALVGWSCGGWSRGSCSRGSWSHGSWSCGSWSHGSWPPWQLIPRHLVPWQLVPWHWRKRQKLPKCLLLLSSISPLWVQHPRRATVPPTVNRSSHLSQHHPH